MQLKRVLPYIAVGILGILLLNLIASNALLMEKYGNRLEMKAALIHILVTLYCFLFGVLLEWRTVVKLVKREAKPSLSPLLIPGFIILLISCISPIIFVMHVGIIFPFPDGTGFLNFLVGPLALSSRIQNILAVAAGVMIMRGLSKNAPGIRE